MRIKEIKELDDEIKNLKQEDSVLYDDLIRTRESWRADKIVMMDKELEFLKKLGTDENNEVQMRSMILSRIITLRRKRYLKAKEDVNDGN